MIPLLIVLVTYLNAPTPTITLAQIASQMASANAQLSAYSYGTFPGFQPTVVGPYIAPINKPSSFSTGDTWGPIQEIIATRGQAFYDSFIHKWFAFNTGGRAAGNGTVTYAPNLGSLTHELVHHLGPGEANSMVCDATQCRFVPYGDQFDIMGSLSGGHPNPSTKRSIKWLDAPGLPKTQTITASGRYTLAPYESLTGIKALVLAPGKDAKRGTFSELFISARGGTNVGLHTCCSLLHDLDLSSVTDYKLDIGQAVLFGTTRITTVSASSTGAVIDVVFNAPSTPLPPPPAPPVQSGSAVTIGGSSQDSARDVVTDAVGRMYIAGGTASADWPRTTGPVFGGNWDAFLHILNADGSVACSTLLGGPNYERAYAAGLGPDGTVYVAGRAGIGMPTTLGTVQPTFGGDQAPMTFYGPQDGFVAAFTPTCQRLWSTYLGGSGSEVIRDLAVTADGVYVAFTAVTQTSLPVWMPASAEFATPRGGTDGLIAKVRLDGTGIVWATYLGGPQNDSGAPSIAVNASRVCLLGGTQSTGAPVTPGVVQPTLKGASDMLLSCWTHAGSRMWTTYLGGSGNEFEETHHLALTADEEPVFCVWTQSMDWPVTPGVVQPTRPPVSAGGELGCAIVAADGRSIRAATYLGGSAGDGMQGIEIWPDGRISVTGSTMSAYPPGYPAPSDGDAMLLVLASDFSAIDWGVRVSGVGADSFRSHARLPDGRIVAVGDAGAYAHVYFGLFTVPPATTPPPDPCVADPTQITVSWPADPAVTGVVWQQIGRTCPAGAVTR
jgi:hypothetical protein